MKQESFFENWSHLVLCLIYLFYPFYSCCLGRYINIALYHYLLSYVKSDGYEKAHSGRTDIKEKPLINFGNKKGLRHIRFSSFHGNRGDNVFFFQMRMTSSRFLFVYTNILNNLCIVDIEILHIEFKSFSRDLSVLSKYRSCMLNII